MRVDEDVIEVDALAFQGLEDEVVSRPEGVLGKGGGAQPVLVADHYQLEVGALGQQAQPPEHTRLELYFLKGVHLFVEWLLNQCAVAVDE